MEFNAEDTDIKELIQMLLLTRGKSLNKLVKILHEKKGFSRSYGTLYDKLKYKTIKFEEIKEIAKELNYSIIFKDNQGNTL